MEMESSGFQEFYKDFKELMRKHHIPYYILKTPNFTLSCGMIEKESKGDKNDK